MGLCTAPGAEGQGRAVSLCGCLGAPIHPCDGPALALEAQPTRAIGLVASSSHRALFSPRENASPGRRGGRHVAPAARDEDAGSAVVAVHLLAEAVLAAVARDGVAGLGRPLAGPRDPVPHVPALVEGAQVREASARGVLR